MFLTISIQFPGTMKDNIVNNEKPTCPYNSMESVPLQGLRRREKGTCWLWKGVMVLWYQNIFWLCFAFTTNLCCWSKHTWDPGYVLDMIRQRRPEKTRLSYNCAHLRSTKESLTLFVLTLVGTWWYLVSIGQWGLIYDNTGSVWSKTGWYMMIMGQ